jgi:hypothetical protein
MEEGDNDHEEETPGQQIKQEEEEAAQKVS